MFNVRLMLYVNDVEASANFWQQYFAAEIIDKGKLPDGSPTIVLKFNDGFELGLCNGASVAKMQPEMVFTTPSLMFFAPNLQAKREKMVADGLPVGEIINEAGQVTFTFPDNEDRKFVVVQQSED